MMKRAAGGISRQSPVASKVTSGDWRLLLASLVVLLSRAGAAPAQEQAPTTPRDSYWVGAGLGAGSEDFAGSLNASYQFGANVVSLRTAATAGLFDQGFNDYALLYGRGTRPAGERYHASVGAGLSLVDGCQGGSVFSDCRSVQTVVGFPIELQFFWRPGSVVGLGLYGFANLNRSRSFAGVTLGLQLGRLR
jgi:hypothetical protein